MLKIRNILMLIGILLSPAASADVQVSIGIGLPHVSIGINVPAYPQLVVVPGYPVYYAPRLQANFFFYDGLYWVYQDDYWYASEWYNGPWWVVAPEIVPVFILRIPVRYYRQPPAYFYGWRPDAPPRWGNHWGRDWEQHRSGWDRWDRRSAPPPAPPPAYQRQYSGDRYPQQVERQQDLHQQNYRYQPRDPVVQQRYQERAVPRAPAQQRNPQQERTQQERQGAPEERGSRQQDMQRSGPQQQDGSADQRSESPQRRGEGVQRSTPASPQQGRPEVQDSRQQPQPGATQREQQKPKSQDRGEGQQDKDAAREPNRGQEQERGRDRNY